MLLPLSPPPSPRLEAERAADEGCPGWRDVLPTDAQLLRESRHVLGRGDLEEAARTRKAAELCTLDMLAVLSQLRYLSAQLHLLWRLLTAAEPAGAHARAAAAASPHVLATLCEIAVHRCACTQSGQYLLLGCKERW